MAASQATRIRSSVVERGMDALVRVDDADRVDEREDAVVARIHQHVHQLERIDRLEDASRAALREDLLALTGYIDRLAPQQLPLMDDREAAS